MCVTILDIMSKPKAILGLITSVSAIKTKKDGKPQFMIDVLSVEDHGVSKVFLSPKVVAHAFAGDSAAAVAPEDIEGRYLSATYMAVGDLLADGQTEVDQADTIINNSTVSFLKKAAVKEIMSF